MLAQAEETKRLADQVLGASSAYPLSSGGHLKSIINTQVVCVSKLSKNMIEDILVDALSTAHSVGDDSGQNLQAAPVQRKSILVPTP